MAPLIRALVAEAWGTEFRASAPTVALWGTETEGWLGFAGQPQSPGSGAEPVLKEQVESNKAGSSVLTARFHT